MMKDFLMVDSSIPRSISYISKQKRGIRREKTAPREGLGASDSLLEGSFLFLKKDLPERFWKIIFIDEIHEVSDA